MQTWVQKSQVVIKVKAPGSCRRCSAPNFDAQRYAQGFDNRSDFPDWITASEVVRAAVKRTKAGASLVSVRMRVRFGFANPNAKIGVVRSTSTEVGESFPGRSRSKGKRRTFQPPLTQEIKKYSFAYFCGHNSKNQVHSTFHV